MNLGPKPLPPYAKTHAQAAKLGYAPARGIFVLDGWRIRKRLQREEGVWQVLVPEDADPASYDWSWIAGFEVLIIGFAARIPALGAALEAAKPSALDCLILGAHGPLLLPWRSRNDEPQRRADVGTNA